MSRMATVSDAAAPGPTPEGEKPEWAMGRRERENARRRREGLRPLRPRWPWVLLILLLLAGGGAWYYQTMIVPSLPVAEVVAAEPEVEIDSRMQVNPFEYATVTPQLLQRVVRVTGTIQPARQAQIASQTSGRVEDVTVRPGDRVAAGDVLVQLDVARLLLDLDLQRSTAAATEVQLTLAQGQLQRVQELVNRGVATASDLDEARTSVEQLQANVSALSDQVEAAELSLDQATVTAPFGGIVSARDVEPGQFVSMGAPVISVVDLSTVELVAQAPVSSGALIAPGQAVAVAVDGLPGRSFAGTVVRINPIATEGARTIPIYITLDNADRTLLGGMFATGEIVVAEAPDAIAVPAEAIREDRDGAHVLTIADGILERRSVTPGESWRGNLVQVTEGLATGDTVIAAALPELSPGDAVVLVE
jgi:RND family efflux transporter MFP subunit